MTSSNTTSGKSRTNTYIAIFLGVVILGLLAFLLFRVDQVEREFGYLRDNKNQIERRIEAEQQNYDELVALVVALEGKRDGLRTVVSRHEALQGQLEFLNAGIAKAAQSLEELQSAALEAATVIAERANAEEKRETALNEEVAINARVGDLEAKRSQLKGAVSAATTDAQDATRSLEGLKREVSQLVSQRRLLETEVADLGQLKADLASIDGKLKERRRQVGELTAEADNLEARIGSAKSSLDNLREKIRLADVDMDQARTDVASEQITLSGLRQQIIEQNDILSRLAKAQANLDTTMGNQVRADVELKQVNIDLQQAADIARELGAKNDTVQEDLTQRRVELSTLTAEAAGKLRELNIANDALLKVNSEVEGLKQTKTDLENRVQALQADVKAENATLLQTQTELGTMLAQRARFETDEAEAAALEAIITEGTRKKDNLTKELAALQASLGVANDKLASAIHGAERARALETQALVLGDKKAVLQTEVRALDTQKEQTEGRIRELDILAEASQTNLSRIGNEVLDIEANLQIRSNELLQATRRLEAGTTVLGNLDGQKIIALETLAKLELNVKQVESRLKQAQADLLEQRKELEAVQSQIANSPEATQPSPASPDALPDQAPDEGVDQ